MDFMDLGSSDSIRFQFRVGSSISMVSSTRVGDNASVTSFIIIGSYVSVSNFARLGSSVSLLAGALVRGGYLSVCTYSSGHLRTCEVLAVSTRYFP